MFERFTEKALNVVSRAQDIASEMQSEKILSEHILLALVAEARGVSLKIFRTFNITYDNLYEKISKDINILKFKNSDDISSFSDHVKTLLKDALDLAAKSGTPIACAGTGKVVFAGWKNGYGYVVLVDHGKGYETLSVSEGDNKRIVILIECLLIDRLAYRTVLGFFLYSEMRSHKRMKYRIVARLIA